MASAQFLEDALNTDVDESAVTALVGSLETQLVTNSPVLSGVHITSTANNQTNLISNGGPPTLVQKQSVPNGETVNVLFNSDTSKSVPTNSLHSIVSTNSAHTVVTAQGIVRNTFVNQGAPNHNQTSAQKANDNVKLVYQAGNQAVNNQRIYPAQSVPNGLAPLTGHNVLQTTQGIVNKTQPTIVVKNSNTGTAGIVTVPLNTNPAMSHMTVTNATVPTVMTLGKQVPTGQQTLVGGAPLMSANVQILNMRPGVPMNQGQKGIAAMAPRVVIGPQMMGTRPGAPGQITLQTLQGLQPGQQGHLLLKTENGQYQLLRVGPVPTGPVPSATGTTATSIAPTTATLRMQQPQQAPTNQGTGASSTIIGSTNSAVVSGSLVTTTNQNTQQVVNVVSANPEVPKANAPLVTSQPGIVRNSVDNTKEKCRKFLANLLELSSREPEAVERNVRTLIQELIDSKVEPEEFCERLERLLNASPQPCLIGFLKKSLPLLRQSLLVKELVIEGIKPPPPNTVHLTATTAPFQVQAMQSQVRLVQPSNIRTSAAIMRAQQTTAGAISSTNPPALHPVSISAPFSTSQQVRLPNVTRSGANIIRSTTPARIVTPGVNNKMPGGVNIVSGGIGATTAATIRGAIQNAANKAISLATANIGQNKPSLFTGNKTIINSSNSNQISRSKEKKSFISAAAYAGDDDINDVAAMGGVNLAEETQRILGSTEMIGTQIRSCKDEMFLHSAPLQNKIRQIVAQHGLEEPGPEVMALISHATQERLKNIVEKLAIIAQHRIDVIKLDPRYESTQDVKGQLKFLEELDRAERKRHEEQEREMLLRAAKSRSKSEDPEQAKLKAKAKEMQRAEMEELRQREANLTALQAIGPRKKAKMEEIVSGNQAGVISGIGSRTAATLRPRLKRVNLRDMLFLLEQEKNTSKSSLLCKSYLK